MLQTQIHFHRTTMLTPEQYIAGLTDFGPGRSKIFGNSADEYLKVHHLSRTEADVTEGSVVFGNACTTTGPIPTTLCSRRLTPIRGAAPPVIHTISREIPTARPILTRTSSVKARTSREGCSASCWGPWAGAS
jgi:hypothetical protein